jgi:hypothetical protein
MNEEKVTREKVETWRWSNWGEEFADCVAVCPPGEMPHRAIKLRHESEIREHWPEKVRSRIRSEILAHRPEGEDEVRSTYGGMWQLRWHDGEKQVLPLGYDVEWETSRGFSCNQARDRAEAWFEKNRPLAENEVLDDDGAVYTMTVHNDGIRFIIKETGLVSQWNSREWLESLAPTSAFAKRALSYLNKHAPKLAENQVLRTRAEQMWLERQPKWSVRWNKSAGWNGKRGAVELLNGSEVVATYFSGPACIFPPNCPLEIRNEVARVLEENKPKNQPTKAK